MPESVFKDNLFAGKKVFITGGATGMGLGFAQAFLNHGAEVFIASRKEEKLAEAASETKMKFGKILLWKTMDVRKNETVEDVAEFLSLEWGELDILVNNAGITRDTLLPRMSDEEFDAVIDTNLRGAFLFMRAVSKHMMSARYGRIINMSSVSGIQGNAGQTNYSASKAGLIGMTRSFSREISRRNVTVNCVAPGFIVTEMTAVLSEDILKKAKAGIPARKLGQVADVAACVTFLASGAASYVTGQTLTVDGGMTG